MGKIVVTELVSLDGVIEAPGGGEGYEHAGWTFEFEQQQRIATADIVSPPAYARRFSNQWSA